MELIRALLTSKKFIAFVIGLIITVLSKYNIGIPADVVGEVVSLTIAYIIGQGIADNGKEAQKQSTIQSNQPNV